MIAIFFNTFLRDELMKRCVASCIKHVPASRLYITDNGRMTDEKKELYKRLQSEGHYVEHKSFNYPWRKSFNEKLDKLQDEQYVLKIDDDFHFDEEVTFIDFLKKDNKLGIIGGQVWHVHRNEPSDYVFTATGEKNEEGKHILTFSEQKERGHIYCDYIPDFWMARREVFNDIKMPPMIPAQGGHERFFTNIYEKRKAGEIEWRVGYTNEVKAIHEKPKHTDEYSKHRSAGIADYKKNIKIVKP